MNGLMRRSIGALFYHLVRAREQGGWNIDVEHLGRFKVDDQGVERRVSTVRLAQASQPRGKREWIEAIAAS